MKITLLALLMLGLFSCSHGGHSEGSADQVEADLMARKPDFRSCYENEIKSLSPKPAGRVDTKFTIESDGRVRQASIEKSTLKLPRTEACLLEVIRSIEFQIPRGTGTVVVNYPFKFSSKN